MNINSQNTGLNMAFGTFWMLEVLTRFVCLLFRRLIHLEDKKSLWLHLVTLQKKCWKHKIFYRCLTSAPFEVVVTRLALWKQNCNIFSYILILWQITKIYSIYLTFFTVKRINSCLSDKCVLAHAIVCSFSIAKVNLIVA